MKNELIPVASDGQTTIGYANDWPSEWPGNMTDFAQPWDVSFRYEGDTYGVEFVVSNDHQWVRVNSKSCM